MGLAGFVALEAATFSRYTDIVVLGCAVIAVLVAWRLRAGRLPGSAVAWWVASVCVFGTGVAIFNTLIYGGPLRSGYRPGEITFSLSAISANLRDMPAHLIQAMPMLVLGLAALAGIAVVWLRGRRAGGEQAALARRDLAVGAALAAVAAIWALYATYMWTAAAGLSTLQAARFYVPALGAISLLGAWLLARVTPAAARRDHYVRSGRGAVGLGGWPSTTCTSSPLGRQLVVVHGPGGAVGLEPGPGPSIGGPGRTARRRASASGRFLPTGIESSPTTADRRPAATGPNQPARAAPSADAAIGSAYSSWRPNAARRWALAVSAGLPAGCPAQIAARVVPAGVGRVRGYVGPLTWGLTMPGLLLIGVALCAALIMMAALVVIGHRRRSNGQSPAPVGARGAAAGPAGAMRWLRKR